MLSIRSTVSVSITKLIQQSLRLLGYHGSSLPGLIMEKLSPNFLSEVASKNNAKIIMVTGTNGKTTTTQIITTLLETQRKNVISNYSGSNFTRGISSTLLSNYKPFNGIKADFIVLEVDEAYAPRLTKIFKPTALVALNVLRDQLDRYGELNKTAEYIGKAARHCESVIINAQDNLLVNITTRHTQARLLFGAAPDILDNINSETNLFEQKNNKSKNVEDYDAILTSYKNNNIDNKINFTVNLYGKEIKDIKWKITGEHNALNATAAILAVCHILPQLNDTQIKDGLKSVVAPYGRGEDILFKKHHLTFNLIKNPSGFNQTINSYLDKSNFDEIVIFINDEYADSRDVSWLWDVNFDKLKQNNLKVYVGGTRKYDMALCLKYQNIKFEVIDKLDIKEQLEEVVKTTSYKKVLVLPTYTAMLQLRQYIAKQNGDKHIW